MNEFNRLPLELKNFIELVFRAGYQSGKANAHSRDDAEFFLDANRIQRVIETAFLREECSTRMYSDMECCVDGEARSLRRWLDQFSHKKE